MGKIGCWSQLTSILSTQWVTTGGLPVHVWVASWLSVCRMSCLRLVAAMQLNEHLPEWFSFAGDVLQQKPKSFDAAGGMYESLNYANFGIQEALQFRIAMKNACPGWHSLRYPS